MITETVLRENEIEYDLLKRECSREVNINVWSIHVINT